MPHYLFFVVAAIAAAIYVGALVTAVRSHLRQRRPFQPPKPYCAPPPPPAPSPAHEVAATSTLEHPKKIEAVVVCVNYADFLAFVLPSNKQYFDKLVVVTTTKDKATQKLCEFWHVQCVVTDVCYDGGAPFNKGKMINAGLAALDGDGWVVHMDADIFLPPKFRAILQDLKLDRECIYGIDRLNCDSFPDWLRFYTAPKVMNENDIFVHLAPFPVGVRVAKMAEGYGGWNVLGFFQLFHGGKGLRYPEEHTDAGRTDLLFSMGFARENRRLIPELVGIHLETKVADETEMGSNWCGRRTPKFGAEVLGDFAAGALPPAKRLENYTD